VLAFANPQMLPGGKAILFVADPGQGPDKFTIEVLTLADHRRKIVARGGQSPRYLGTSSGAGHLVYVNKATLGQAFIRGNLAHRRSWYTTAWWRFCGGPSPLSESIPARPDGVLQRADSANPVDCTVMAVKC
jgi:hypothetical protein